MKPEEFVKQALRTESPQFNRLNPRILHAAFGFITESGEFADALKKSMFYGKELDVVNLKEEAGDILWYMAILFDELDTSFEEEMERVIGKLKIRFPEKFTEELAETRDLDAERKHLEK